MTLSHQEGGKGRPGGRFIEIDGRVTRRPSSHTDRSVSLGLEAPRCPLRGTATNPNYDYHKPADAKVNGERVRVKLPQPRPDNGTYRHVGRRMQEEVASGDNAAKPKEIVRYSDRTTETLEDALSPLVRILLGEVGKNYVLYDSVTVANAPEEDLITALQRGPLRTAGDGAILGDEFVDRVVGEDGIDEDCGDDVSLEVQRLVEEKAEEEAEAQDLFDYMTAAGDREPQGE